MIIFASFSNKNFLSLNPQVTLMQGILEFFAVKISTSESPTYIAWFDVSLSCSNTKFIVSGAGFLLIPAASFSPIAISIRFGKYFWHNSFTAKISSLQLTKDIAK